MLPNLRTKSNLTKILDKSDSSFCAKSPGKYTFKAWEVDNNYKCRMMKEQELLKDIFVNHAENTIVEVNETTKGHQDRVKHLTKERAAEIAFLADELQKQRKQVVLELENIGVYHARITKAIELLEKKALPICQQCIKLRDCRIGIENCNDEVDRTLRQELQTIKGGQDLLYMAEKETKEQMRLLRAAMYKLDKDLEGKSKAKMIDEENYKLNQAHHFLGRGANFTTDYCLHSLADWYDESDRNLVLNQTEIVSAGNLRWYINIILKEVCEDMINQTEHTNDAFRKRINEVKGLKTVLEEKYQKTSASIMDINRTIEDLEVDIKDKERAILLCKTRLGNRLYRPGIELTCDYVQEALYSELNALQTTMCKLQQKLTESKAFLRYLSHTQIVQLEEINLKANSIKIDECECMTLRSTLMYTKF